MFSATASATRPDDALVASIEVEVGKDGFKPKARESREMGIDIVNSESPVVHAHVDTVVAVVPNESIDTTTSPDIIPMPATAMTADETSSDYLPAQLHANAVEAEGGVVHDVVDDNVDDDNDILEPSEAYLAQCYALGILSRGKFNDLDNFELLKDKVRQLALRSGFRVRVQRPSSGHRRVWICKSKPRCPFAIVGNKNRRGVSLVTKLAHNHTLHFSADNAPALSLCEASTQEMATFVRNSELYANSPSVSKITAQQISNVVHAKTGYHINAMRASRIKHMLLDDPERYFVPGMSVPFTSSSATESSTTATGATVWKTLAEAIWDGFMIVVNDPVTVQSVGVAAVKKMVTTFKKPLHKDTLRSIILMSCPNPEALPSSTSNRPNPIKFLDAFHRHEQFGFFE
ncbi:hypothetical protein H310_06719 [Aphanomyces invadans]|uniref:Uncharacterized protein n=1 Tax=Aphanomyces invadans TaxID=157072 RepID=A0A024U4C6_9STRA|nr:hypothetical protein H310_06719 [Aphanomyces invadans]ETW01104.1 hypothetical protein H310_06719 [Aphanomyces invadans]|eukprot:XP_008870102.1 hypothetical protein H310_06719 [Aphanomyces invadans]